MSTSGGDNLTVLLARVREGDEVATRELLAVAYAELRQIAGSLFRDQPGDHTLQPTALVNEVCAKLLSSSAVGWNDRKHFFRAAAQAMRNLLADHARAKGSRQRGGGALTISLEGSDLQLPSSHVDLVALDEAITRLSNLDKDLGQIFNLRFLVGLSVETTAQVAEVSPRKVEIDTRFIRAWLQKELVP